MKITELLEARKNPEQNPKVSVNQRVIDALNATTDEVANTPNLFVSFTKLDKLGVNPLSEYDTPIGIYAYPAQYVDEVVGKYNPMNKLPFAGDSPYVNLFNAQGNIIDISKMSPNEVNGYYKKYQNCGLKHPKMTGN